MLFHKLSKTKSRIHHLINTAVLVSPSPRYSEKDIKQKRLDVKARKRLNVSQLAGAELERILARTMLCLVERLTFPPSFTAMTLKKTCWSARNYLRLNRAPPCSVAAAAPGYSRSPSRCRLGGPW